MREPGYYWVKYRGVWMPADYESFCWMLIGYDGPVREEELDEIGERLEHS
jgi:hypothetical protein